MVSQKTLNKLNALLVFVFFLMGFLVTVGGAHYKLPNDMLIGSIFLIISLIGINVLKENMQEELF